MAVTDNTDAAIFVALDGSITKLINVCASDVFLVQLTYFDPKSSATMTPISCSDQRCSWVFL
ncbi:unnamed protein product [Brassica rapa]|uniref:Uncharacterized protein n=2 Tax=Brassica TaxID=3705 RepID=A0A8D9G211_BRACM|nr:unnamed protein product [Brassica napus]CAG7866188.1 unnamed protein product [Brassica rapa]